MKNYILNILSFLRRHNAFVRALSFVLCLVMVFYVIPSTIYAKAAELGGDNSESIVPHSDTAASSEPSVIDPFEVVELREETAKHFRLSDGSYVAAQYNYPVHSLDENGEWQDIDNVLTKNGSEFTNESARIKFAKKINGSSTLFALHDGNNKITLNLIGAEKGTKGEVTNRTDAEEDTELQKMMNLEKLSSSIIYRDILDGVDIEYVAYSMNVKENIIVKEKKDSYSYSFELKLNGLTPALTESGDIELSDDDTGEIRYVIPAPVVYDASGVYAPAEASAYTLTHENGKKYVLTIAADSAWMNAEERAFPVTIDPAIYSDYYNIVDTYVSSENPNTIFSSSDVLKVNSGSHAYFKTTSLPNLPSSAHISSATVSLSVSRISDNYFIGAYKVLTDWDANITWASYTDSSAPKGEFDESPVDYVILTVDKFGSWDPFTGAKYATWNITSIIDDWYSGDNYGVAFASVDNMPADVKFFSIENTSMFIPQIVITYRDMKGLESYWSYSSSSAGIGGNGNINLANGNLTFSIPTLTTTDGIFGYTPTLYYNSYLANKTYTYGNTKTAYSTSYMPLGFKLNMSETIISYLYSEEAGSGTKTAYVHTDSDGTEHTYFKSSNSDNEYRDEDALGKVMTIESDKIEITDDSHIIKRFFKIASTPATTIRSAWYLAEIEDSTGNKLVFDFDSSYKPTKIKLIPNGSNSAILLMTLLYTADGKLSVVFDHGTQNAIVLKYSATYNGSIVYSGGKYLKKIEYCYIEGYDPGEMFGMQGLDIYANEGDDSQPPCVDSSVTYYYTNNGELYFVNNDDNNQGIEYSHLNNKIIRVTEYGREDYGRELNYSYGNNYTDVSYYENVDYKITTRYIFDSYGRAVYKYSSSDNGTEIHGATIATYDSQENSKNSINSSTVIDKVNTNLLLNSNFLKVASNGNFEYWNKSSNVTKTSESIIELSQPTSISMSPTLNYDAYIYQDVVLNAGDYSLTVPYSFACCNNVKGIVEVTNTTSGANICIEERNLLNSNCKKTTESFALTFSLSSKTTVRVKITFEAFSEPVDGMSISIGMIKLEESSMPSVYSFVDYGSFNSNALINNDREDTLRALWTYSDHTGGGAFFDLSSIRKECITILGKIAPSYVKQTVYSASQERLEAANSGLVDERSTDSFVVSGFAKAVDAVPTKNFGIRVDVTYYMGENTDDYVATHYFGFLAECTDWQFTSGEFSMDENQDGSPIPEYLCVKSIEIFCEVSYQPTKLFYFDDISLVYNGKNKTIRNEFNEKGQLVCTETGDYVEYYEYNADGNISRFANSDGDLWDYTYDTINKNAVISINEYTYTSDSANDFKYPYLIDDPDSVIEKDLKKTTVFQYNNYGQTTSSITVDATNDSVFAISEYTYNENLSSKLFGRVLTEQSKSDMKMKYFYEEHSGRLLASINVYSGSGYVYTYDEMGRLLRVYPVNYTASNGTYSANKYAEQITFGYGNDGRISEISTRSTDYYFYYDGYGNTSCIEAGNHVLATYEYEINNGELKKVTYGNGYCVEYVYNNLNQLAEVKNNDVVVYRYEYTANSQLFRLYDIPNNTVTVYYYNQEGKFVGYKEFDTANDEELLSVTVGYNDRGLTSAVKYGYEYTSSYGTSNGYIEYSYDYLNDGRINRLDVTTGESGYELEYCYDTLDRIAHIMYNSGSGGFSNTVDYTYIHDSVFGETGLVGSYSSTINGVTTAYTYTYDSNGNITKISYSDGHEIRYYYDYLNQIVREDNSLLDVTYLYSYDFAGNIIEKDVCPLTPINQFPNVLYEYVEMYYSNGIWGDLMIDYDGISISYDGIGNPINYYNGFIFEWDGRRLVSAETMYNSYSYVYNEAGLRIKKIKNNSSSGDLQINYYYDGTTLIKEETSDYTIIYLYDAFASPIGFKYRATEYESNVWDEYFYEKNLQGDIVGIYNADGVMLVSYVYDAWGNFVTRYHNGGANTTAVNNHFTYRGYYYDSDLGLYYLQSRYYDSNTGRFINADALMSGVTGSLKGYNLFAYCFNNPVAFTDSEGNWPKQLEEKLESFKGWCKDKLCEIDFFDELINADKSNCDVNVVMQADYFAYYEEHLVIKVNAYFYASFNVIIVDRNTDINIFKHEYGHALQYEKLGFKQYLTEIAIPSIVAWGVRENGLLPFEYYSSPWESEANSYGGVKLSDSRRRSWTEADGKYNYLLDLLFK